MPVSLLERTNTKQFSLLYKFRDIRKDKLSIVGGLVRNDTTGEIAVFRRDELFSGLSKDMCSNAKLSIDDKIIGCKGISVEERVIDDKHRVLWHGSRGGIVGEIKPESRYSCDFGSGFYMGTNKLQAAGLVATNPNAYLYCLYLDCFPLNVYKFKSPEEWVIYVGINRGLLDLRGTTYIKELFKSLGRCDVIIGDIADDKTSWAYRQFVSGSINLGCLVRCLKLIREYEFQYVAKTSLACSQIEILAMMPIDSNMSRVLTESNTKLRENLAKRVNECITRYNLEGKSFEQLRKECR